MSISIVSAFQSAGIPAVGLTPHVTVYDLTDSSVVVSAEVMTEIANGLYKYLFVAYDPSKEYAIYVDGGDTLAADRYQYAGEGALVSVLDDPVEGTYTMREALRIMLAVLAGKASGGGTATIVFRDVNDSKDRVEATVDVNGNRSTVILDVS